MAAVLVASGVGDDPPGGLYAFEGGAPTVLDNSDTTGLAVSPDGTRVYVANSQQQSLTIVDATRNVVASTLQLPTQPREIVVAPNGRLYVSVRGAVVVLDTAGM